MAEPSLWLLLFIIALAIGFGVVNGFNDAANAIAPTIGTHALSPRNALIIAVIANMIGAATGTAVARTIGKGILVPEAITYVTIIAALAAIIIWGALATYLGMPISLTHGFVAGLAAAGIAEAGSEVVVWSALGKVLSAVVIAPLLGFAGAFLLMVVIFWVFRRTALAKLRVIFSRLQILSAAFIAYAHGKNDGQMPIGIIAMALVIYYQATGQFGQAAAVWERIPWWVIIASALAISFGTAIGGWRVIGTLGMKITTLRPVRGFTAQASAAAVIETASQLGIPISTTHCISSAVMGVGATRRFSAVHWGVAGNIITAWILTFPICGGLGYLIAWLLGIFF
ncbi:MAG: inorganic phosphate transporter [Dehalococcoidia bacterium]|nr:MAG: inorganic phosphate transporter [Dehalococcoidia bacterium]